MEVLFLPTRIPKLYPMFLTTKTLDNVTYIFSKTKNHEM